MKLPVVVLRPPHAGAGLDGDRSIRENRRGSERFGTAGWIHRRNVDEGLEKRARLPLCLQRAIELTPRIAPPADERLHIPRSRLNRDDDTLERLVGLSDIRVVLGQPGDSLFESLLGLALHHRVESREDAESLGLELRRRIRLAKLLHDEIDEVGRAAERAGKLVHRHRSLARFFVLLLRDHLLFVHHREDRVAPFLRALGIPER